MCKDKQNGCARLKIMANVLGTLKGRKKHGLTEVLGAGGGSVDSVGVEWLRRGVSRWPLL